MFHCHNSGISACAVFADVIQDMPILSGILNFENGKEKKRKENRNRLET